MSNAYTSVSVTGYNSSPPDDDGSETEANRVKWSTIKSKLPDPLKTAIESTQTNLQTGFEYLEAGVNENSFTTAGSSNTYTITTGKTVTPFTGMVMNIVWNHESTGAATLNVDGDGAAAINLNGAAIASGDLSTDGFDIVRYDGTIWEIMNKGGTILKNYGETVNIIGSIGGGTQDISMSDGNVVTGTVDTSTTTFTFSNPKSTGISSGFALILTNGGSQTVNWPGSVDWAGSVAPTLASSGIDVLTFFTVDGGTIWYGFPSGLDMQ